MNKCCEQNTQILQAELERLKKYNNDEDAESLRGFRVLYASLKKERDHLQTDIVGLRMENDMLVKDIRELKAERIEYREIIDEEIKKRIGTEFENKALKRAAIEQSKLSSWKLGSFPCYTCTNENDCDNCDNCDDDFSGWVFEADRFKDGGGRDA